MDKTQDRHFFYRLYFLCFKIFVLLRFFHKTNSSSLKQIYYRYLENKSRIPSMNSYDRAYYCSNLIEVFRSYIYDNIYKKSKKVRKSFFEGFKIEIYPDNEMTRIPFITSTYEEETMKFLKSELKDSDIVLDIGANNGYYSLYCSSIVDKVIAFEPSKRDNNRLMNNLKLNNISNVIVEEIGLSDSKKELELLVCNDYNSGHNTLSDSFVYGTELKEKEIIKVDSLDSYCKENNIDYVDVIKIDVEGHEINVFRGAKDLMNKKPRLIIFEIIDKLSKNRDELIEIFTSYGYEIFYIDNSGLLTKEKLYSSGNLVAKIVNS